MPIFAYIYPLLVMVALFVDNSILFTVPKGNGNAFACFVVSEQIAAPIPFLQFGHWITIVVVILLLL